MSEELKTIRETRTPEEQWDSFVAAIKAARSKVNLPALPIQIIVYRDGLPIAFGGMRDGDMDDVLRGTVAMLGGLCADHVLVGADSFYVPDDSGINPETGEEWVDGEMAFDFQENPNTIVMEGIMLYQVDGLGKVVNSATMTYARDENDFPVSYGELTPTVDGAKHFQAGMDFLTSQLQAGQDLQALRDLWERGKDEITPEMSALMDTIAVKAIRGNAPNLQLALTVDTSEDSDARNKELLRLAKENNQAVIRPGTEEEES